MPAAMSGSTTSDPEGTRLYPVLVLLDANGHVPTANNADPLAADTGAATAVASPADPASSGVEPSASSWLLHPHALATQVIPAFAAQLAAAGNDLHDVVLLTREELENSQPKKKGGGAAKDVKKKKGEEMTAEEQYEAAHFSLSRDLCEVLRDRIEGELAVAREAMLERRRAEAEAAMAADPASAAGAADPRAAGKGRPGAKKPVLSAAAAAAAALANKKPPTPATGASGAGASPTSNSRSVKKSGSGKNSTIASRSASPGGSKPTTPRQGARPDSSLGFGLGATDPSAPSSSSGPRFPSSLPVHFVLFDLVRTVGDAARVQDVLNQCLDVCILLEDPALAAASAAARAASAESDAQEFLYGSPTGATTDSSGHPLSAVEQRLHREAREDAVARAPVPRPHPHDQTVYGVGAPAQEIKAAPGSLLEALLREQKKQQQAQSAGGAAAASASASTSFRNLVFLPVVLPEPTAAPTLGTSIAGAALATPPQAQQPPGSPSANARRSGTGAPAGSPSASSAGASSSAQKDGAAAAGAKRKPGAKGAAAPEQAAPPTAEQELVASTVQTLVLSLREFSAARADFERWASGARIVDMPAAPGAASAVDTRLYAHLLGQLPPGQVDVPTILYALFEQVAVNAPAPAAAQASASAGAAGAGASPDTPAAAAGAAAATPGAVDLSDFFAGEKLDELEEYMSRALERVTFNAGGAPALGHGHAHAGWAEKARALPPCPSALGGRHQFEGDSLGNGSGDASGSACCTTCTNCGATEASLVLTAAESPLGGVVGAGQSFIPYGDELAQRRAEAALALGLPLEADSLSMAAEALLASHWPLPGVGRRGMPSRPDESALAQAGSEATTLLARASHGARASPAVVERALLLLEMEEMLMAPPPEFKFTHLAAADPSQEAVREVRVVPPLHASASAGSGFAASPAAALASPMRASMTVRERAPSFSLYHVTHTHSEAAGPVVEAAVAARMRELHCIAKARSGPGGNGGFGPGFGLRDESDSGEWRRAWGLESREYTEELCPRVLAQRILRASLSPSGSANTTVRYRPLSDELIVAIATPLPLRRERDRTWSAYLAPNLSLAAWIASGPAVQGARPAVVYNYTDTGHTGQLAERVHTFYPLDQARVSMVTGQVSSSARAVVLVEKDGVLLCMEQARIEDDEEAAKEEEEEKAKAAAQAKADAAAATAAAMEVVEEDEFHSSGRNSSRPGSSSRGDGTARSERDSARRGSASRERSGSIKKQLSSGSSSSASGAGAAPLGSGPAASLKKQGSAGPKTASSKKKALAEQKEADEAAALLAAQQAEAEAAARAVLDAEAAAQARLRAPPRHPRSAIILSARLSTGARMTFSGARGDGSNRATYTTRQGLVVELRGRGDEVYMKYPRSVLERGASPSPAALAATIQPVVPARKHGVPEAVAAAAAAAAAGSSNTAAVEFPLPPLVSPAPSSELFRSVSPSGAVYRLHDDGCAYLLLPNGHVGFRGGNKAGWVWTDNDGKRVGRRTGSTQVRLGGVEVARQYDAESGASVWTRADHAMFISYAGGSSLAQHADGTRIYTDDLELEAEADQGQGGGQARELGEGVSVSPARRRVVVEHPRFPPITFTHHVRTSLREAAAAGPDQEQEEEGEEEEQDRAERYAAGVSAGVDRAWSTGVQIAFPADGGHTKLTKHASTDAVSLVVRGGEELLALPQGRVVFVPPTFDRTTLPKGFTEGIGLTPSPATSRGARGEEQAALPAHLYDFDLTFVSSGRLRLADQEDNLFRLSCAGVAEMQLGRERNLDDQDEGGGGRGGRGRGGDTIPASYYPLPSRPLPPRMFVVRSDGGGYELLHDEEVNAFLARVDSDPDTVCMPPEAFIDPSNGGGGDAAAPASSREPVAVSMKYLTTLRAPPSYVRHPVIPNVVRAAPSALAAGSSLATLAATEPVEVLRGRREHATALAGAAAPALVYRHLVNQPVVTAAQKARVAAERAAFADWKESQRAAECRYDLDAARAGAAGRSPEQLREEERVAEEVARAKAALRAHQGATKSALAIHQEVALSEAAGGAGSGRPTSAAGRRTRPSTANAHRQPSSQHLLPRPLHEQDEAAKVVEQMVATLTAPPKTFFAAKAGGAEIKQKKTTSSRPGSASASAPEQQQQQQQQQLGNFFAQPSFRRDFLLATLAQRMHDLAAPYLPGTRLREQEEQDQGQQSHRTGSGSGTQQSASEKEALWRSLDEQQRADYRGQYRSQLRLLVSHVADFLALASSFLIRAYSAPAREVLLQSEPYSTLLERAHPAFAGLVGSVAAVLGFERDCEKHVLTVSDAEFKLNALALRRKMEEILREADEAEAGAESESGPLPPAASAGKAAKKNAAAAAEEKEKETPRDIQADGEANDANGDDGQDDAADFDDGVDYEAVVASLSGAERAAYTRTPAYKQYLSREARLRSIRATYSTQQHAPHGGSFQFRSAFAPAPAHLPPAPGRTSLPANPLPTAFDVTGAPRKQANRVALPAAHGPAAPAALNQRHLLAELQAGQPRPAPKTASTAKQSWHDSTAPFARFVLQPAELDLGPLRKGCTYRAVATLTNAGAVTGRFQVVQPAPRGGLDLVHVRAHYRPGLVAPGMQRRIEVEIYAGTAGPVEELVEVRSEQHVFHLPLRATVMHDGDYARAAEAGMVSEAAALQGGAAAAATGATAAAAATATTTGSVGSVRAPALNATYERDFPASPKKSGPAGPFHLTSSFGHPTKAGPAFSKNASAAAAASQPALGSTVPRGSFGQTGEIRMVAQGPTPHIAQALSKTQARGAPSARSQAHHDDSSEI